LIIDIKVGDDVKTNGAWLEESLERAVRIGEGPYQSNRKALQALDIYGDVDDGADELIVMLEGLDAFIITLEAFKNVTDKVARNSLTSVR
jgi:hypothetical protein